MTVYLNLLDEQRTTKPDAVKDAPIIQNKAVHPVLVTLPELLEVISHGGTFRPCAINGSGNRDFVSGQIHALDFDNLQNKTTPLPKEQQITIDEAIKKASENGLVPFAAYHTFSNFNNPFNLEKFRLLFVADHPTTDRNQWEFIQSKVRNIFPTYQTDKATQSPQNLFYGTNQGIYYTNLEAVLNTEALLKDYRLPKESEAYQKPTRSRTGKPRANGWGSGTKRAVEALRNHDSGYLRRKLGRKKTVFDNRKEFFDFVYREIDLSELLDVEQGQAFSCVLPSHGSPDEHPSANVFRGRFGEWHYKCFSEVLTLNPKQFIETMGDFRSEYQALEFIKAVYNIRIRETKWSVEQLENIESICDAISGTDEHSFKALCPVASGTTRHAQALFLQVLTIARSCIYPERTSETGNIIFFMSIRQLVKASGRNSLDKVSKAMKLLLYHGLIEIVPDEEVPKRFLRKAIEGKAESNHCHIQFYSIPSWIFQRMQYIEAQGQQWRRNGYRMGGISYEMFLRCEGEAVAAKLYPQTAHFTGKDGKKHQKKTGRKADERHEQAAAAILEAIETQGYVTEKQVILALKNMGNVTAEVQIKRSLTDIMNCYHLKKVRATKQAKQRFSIDSKGYPYIIITDEDG